MKKILAIDDNEINLELLRQVVKLQYPDFEYLRADSGREGIEIARKKKPELILLDILMPGMDGYQVCKILKGELRTKDIPILMISALGQDSAERIKGLNAGADAFISKPFVHSELQAQINVALRIKGVEDLLRRRNENLEHFIKDQTNKYLRSEERFLQISEHAREFYWEVDSGGIFTYVSPVIEKTLGVSSIEIIGKQNYIDFFKLKENNIEIEITSTERFNDIEIKIDEADSVIWLSASGFTITDKKGKFKGKRGMCFDITKRKLAEIQLKQNVEQIEKYQKQLKKLNTEITLIEERERRRIAENLHDSLGQTLSFAYIKLSALEEEDVPSNVKKAISEISDILNSAISESRTLTYDLSPPILYELGLIPAFKWKLDQIERSHKIKTVLMVESKQIQIQKSYNIFLYRIVSELLANVVKHASAGLIELEILKNDDSYNILVRDNGIGFDYDLRRITEETSGFGLMSIKERVESFNGRFEIESEPGKGTEAQLVIPF